MVKRQHARYPTSIHCTVRPPGGPPIMGVVENLSVGGMAIALFGEVRISGPIVVEILDPGGDLSLPCRVRGRRQLWNRTILHTQFSRLSEKQHSALEGLIAECIVAQRSLLYLRAARRRAG